MVSITLSVPEETRKKMKKHPEINWSGFIREAIEEKTRKEGWKKEMLKKIREEDETGFTDWTISKGNELKKNHSSKKEK